MSRKSDQVLVRENHALPRTKAGISTLVRELLEHGGACERIIIEQGQPVRVWRWQDVDDMEEGATSLDGALRNAEMLEYTNPNEDSTAAEVVMHMMHILSAESSHPVCWVLGPGTEALEKWLQLKELGLPVGLKDLMHVPFQHLESLPPETLILAGSAVIEGDVGDIRVAVKAAMEPRRESDGEVVDGNAHRVGDHPDRDSAAVSQVEGSPRRNGAAGWSPSNFLRERLRGGNKIR